MQLALFHAIFFFAVGRWGLPQFATVNTTTLVDSDAFSNGSSLLDEGGTGSTGSLGQIEPFELNIRRGIRVLNRKDTRSQYRLHGILAMPGDAASGTRSADFTRLSIMFADSDLSRVLYTDTRDRSWSEPKERIFAEIDQGGKLWQFNDLQLKLSESFVLLKEYSYTGPWSMIMIVYPERDPQNGRDGTQPFFVFTDAATQGRVVMVRGDGRCIIVKDQRRVNGIESAKNISTIVEVTK